LLDLVGESPPDTRRLDDRELVPLDAVQVEPLNNQYVREGGVPGRLPPSFS
jgi:hypothetical protein